MRIWLTENNRRYQRFLRQVIHKLPFEVSRLCLAFNLLLKQIADNQKRRAAKIQ
ncbi:hypothetical protein [Paenibacillus odorifer]|uniref:hypothetical protein n=1 Tax=Paenibacillus sp. FSL H3-0329 TaxID=2954734 RepID=UPI0015C3D028